MTARLWHLYRTELRSYRWELGAWWLLFLIVGGSSTLISYAQNHLTLEEWEQGKGFVHTAFNWFFGIATAGDPWLWFAAGLLAAWIMLADPLQSPPAFWVTRPVRAGELLRVRALVCLIFLALLPVCFTVISSAVAGASFHNSVLSGLSTLVVKAGLVPLGFAIGALWPRPGRRWFAMLPLAGWWLGASAWTWFNPSRRTDYYDHSLTYAVLWLLVMLALPWIICIRRTLWSQGIVGACVLALPWLTQPIMLGLEAVPQKTPQAAGLPQGRLSATPHNFYITEAKDTSVELDLHMDGLPTGTAAEVLAAHFEIEWPDGKRSVSDSQERVFLMSTWYAAEARIMGVSPDHFPQKWRHGDDFPAIILKSVDLNALSGTQAIKVTGQIHLRLHQFQPFLQDTYHEKWQYPGGGLRLKGVPGEMTVNGGSMIWLRPWLAEAVAKGDTSDRGILFNPVRTRWCTVLQPPVQTGPGKFSREARGDPPLWADSGGGACSFTNFFGWNCAMQSNDSFDEKIPELSRLRSNPGIRGLPVTMLSCTSVAEIALPLEPLALTRQQILDTRKITPTKP